MKVLVIGAAGRSGKAVVEAALSAGHQVTALVHTIGQYQPADVTVIEGDATDMGDMALDASVAHFVTISTPRRVRRCTRSSLTNGINAS